MLNYCMSFVDKEQPVCAYHPNKKGEHTCGKCGKKICFECVSVSYGKYVCVDCDPDFRSGPQETVSLPPKGNEAQLKAPGKLALLLRNPKYAKWIMAFSLILFLGTAVYIFFLFKNPPYGNLSLYRVAYYPVKSEGKSIGQILEAKGLRPEWKFLENRLTQDGGFFVFFQNPEATGVKPIWFVLNEVPFPINKDARDLCNSELSETAVFPEKGLGEEDIVNYIYGEKH